MSKCLSAGALLLLLGCGAQASTYDEAVNAYNQNRVGEAEAALRKIAADPASKPVDKAKAYRELARIAWVIDGRAEGALTALAKAEATGEAGCDNARLHARILQEALRSAQLLADAETLARRCTDAFEAGLIQLDAAEAALDLAAIDPAARVGALAKAKALTGQMHADVRGSLKGSALALQLGLLTGDAPMAVKAWKDYFWLTGTDVPQGMAGAYPAAAPVFTAGLSQGASTQSRLLLLDMLVQAGFAAPAERYAASTGLPVEAAAHALWRKASAYFEARRKLEAELLTSNRRVARGGKAADLDAAVNTAAGKLMAAAGLSGDPRVGLRQAYGLYGTVGDTDGYPSVHYGHIVQDERRAIEQYGHRASVAFLALDNMISNGFNSWLWDGSAAAGGWTAPGPVIVQVRPEYTSSPLSAWSLFSVGSRRQRTLDRQPARMAADLAALKRSDVAYLPGLADRLHLQAVTQVGDRARAAAGPAGNLRTAFLNEYWRATLQHSIYSHEGRHALDRELVRGVARFGDSNLEYRAKLSELALSDYPRMAFGSINDSTIGSGNAHGKANERVLMAYADWMRRSSRSIAGYDSALPALVQLDKLSDAQIRAVARSLDPIAR